MRLSRSHDRQRVALSLFAYLTPIACTSWRIQPVAPATLIEERHPTAVQLTLLNGSKVVAHSPIARGDSVIGLRTARSEGEGPSDQGAEGKPPSSPADPSETVAIPVNEIRWIAVERGDTGKTFLLVAGVIAFFGKLIDMACGDSACHW